MAARRARPTPWWSRRRRSSPQPSRGGARHRGGGGGGRARRPGRERARRAGARAPTRRSDRNGAGGMSDSVYALYPCFRATRGFRDLDFDDAAQEVENLFKEWDGSVSVRGAYSTAGFRADTDLMLWLVGPGPPAVPAVLVPFGSA